MATRATSKIQFVLHPPLPGTCVVCNKSANGETRFLDFGAQLDFYGAILMCEDCGKELVDILDFVPVAQVKYRDKQIENLVVMNRELKDENDNIRAALNAVLVVRPDLRPDSDSPGDVDSKNDGQGTKRGTSKK